MSNMFTSILCQILIISVLESSLDMRADSHECLAHAGTRTTRERKGRERTIDLDFPATRPCLHLVPEMKAAFFNTSMNAGRSLTRITTRFHPPGSCCCPLGIGRDPDARGPLSRICASASETHRRGT